MAPIMILGGSGRTGRLIAEHLLECTPIRVSLAARDTDRTQAASDELNKRFPGGRVRPVFADAADGPSLRSALADHSMLIVASPTTAHAETVIRAALEAGVDYLDVQLGTEKWRILQSLAGPIEAAGLCFVTEAGFHPGLPSALVRWAATEMDAPQKIVVAGYLNMGHDLPYSEAVDELVELFKDYDARIFSNGRWFHPSFFKTLKVEFGGDIGRKQAYPMFFPELQSLPDAIPSIKELGFYISETHWMTDWVITPVVLLALKVFPNAVQPIGKLLWWGMQTFHKPPYRVELMVEASGLKDGAPAVARASVAHPDGYELTAIPVVATLLQVLDGFARRPGLWMMGHLVDPSRLMHDMARMGVHVEFGPR